MRTPLSNVLAFHKKKIMFSRFFNMFIFWSWESFLDVHFLYFHNAPRKGIQSPSTPHPFPPPHHSPLTPPPSGPVCSVSAIFQRYFLYTFSSFPVLQEKILMMRRSKGNSHRESMTLCLMERRSALFLGREVRPRLKHCSGSQIIYCWTIEEKSPSLFGLDVFCLFD
jgi:hypothetical protein